MNLAHDISKYREDRIWAASYDAIRDAFRVAFGSGRTCLLQRPIPDCFDVPISDLIANR